MLYLMYIVILLHFREKHIFLKYYRNFSLHSDTKGRLFLLYCRQYHLFENICNSLKEKITLQIWHLLIKSTNQVLDTFL